MPLSNTTAHLLASQYFDDWYTPSDADPSVPRGEDFDFHRILFRPRMPVQSRELTQIQTLLQHQLERLGNAQFHDGEAVFGGQLSLDTSVLSGQVGPTTNLVALFDRTTNAGKYVFDTGTTTTKAHVLQFQSIDEGLSNNYLIFKQQTSTPFVPGTVVQAADDATITATFAAGVSTDVFQNASIVSIDEGVFFVSGFFVRVTKQTLVLNPFSSRPSYRIGLELQEQVLDELDDVVGASLLDPANQNAPGAHRFRIKLALAKRTLTTGGSDDANFIELARVVDGEILNSKQTPKFVRLDELNSILARRTYDEAGDYIVKPFTPVIETNPADDETFILSLGPGKAYVRGFEINTSEPNKKIIRKGRATNLANNRSIPLPVGNFVYATRVAASQPTNYFANTTTVDLHAVKIGDIDPTSVAAYRLSKIGQAKVRMIETFEIPNTPSEFANNSVRKLFFYDVVNDNVTGNLAGSPVAVVNGTAITVTLPIANGTPHVNGSIEGTTIVLGGAASPVSGTFTVNNYVYANASHAFVTLKEYLPTLPTTDTTYKLVFQMKDVDSFALFDSGITAFAPPFFANLGFQADVHIDSKVGGVLSGETIVEDNNDNLLLFQIPEKFVKANTISAGSAIWKSWMKTSANAQTFVAQSNLVYTVSVSGSNFSIPTGNLSATTASEFLMIFDQTNDSVGHGRIINFFDTPGATDKCISNVQVTAVGSTYNIQFNFHYGATTSTTRSLVGLAKATVSGLPVRQKALIVGNTTAVLSGTSSALNSGQIEFHSLNAAAGFAYSLKTTDVFRIKKVLYKSANTAFTTPDLGTATDVTSLFSLDNGQRDNTYEYSQLIAGPNASSVVRPAGRLLVIFDWFSNSGKGYADVDSYLSSTNLANGMTYDIIPSYTSAKTNRTVNLRDVLDFRPMRSNFDFIATSLIFAASDTSSNTTYLTATAEAYMIPVSDDVWVGSYEYFLSRIDKVGLAFDGNFKIIEGQDDPHPVAPTADSGSLLLFQLAVPAYTLVDSSGVPTSVLLTTFDHKRYTMQDLSKMDDRVSHLEYYTALSGLENLTKNTPVLDSDQNERFKNGIVVDAFHGGETGDMGRLDFTASLDTTEGELRAGFRSFAVQFAADLANSTSQGVTLIGDMAIPSYNEVSFIDQPLATQSTSVNPFDVASFYGTMTLSPAVDVWKDVNTAPATVVDLGGPSQTWIDANLPSFTNWGEWDKTWSGVTNVTPRHQFFTPPGWTPGNHDFRSMTELSWNDVTTATTYQRQGTQFEFKSTSTTTSLGNQIVDVSVVHNMRQRDIIFAADGLKPQSNLYAFFDGTAVSKYVQQANVLQLSDVDVSVKPPKIGQIVYVQKAISGNVATTISTTTLTGTGSVWQYELVPGTLIRIAQGINNFDGWISAITSNTAATLSGPAAATFATGTVYTLTPVIVADVASRFTGNTVQYTLKVVRATVDADLDRSQPPPIVAGCLRAAKLAKDTANTTTGATVLIPASARSTSQTMNVSGAICKSGVVRDWNAGTGALRFDLDILDAAVSTVGTTIYFPAGPGAGQTARVLSYTAANQTAILDNTNLPNLTPGKTIYSAGAPVADGFIANNSVTSGRAGTVAGCFHLPSGMFAVGTRLFRVTDDPTNTVNNATCTAETNYTASGVSYTQQGVSVTSRALDLKRAGVKTESMTITDSSVQGFAVQYIDPLAETFLVDAKLFPQGVFITSVDLCFATKPSDDIPVTLEIRPVVNGYPASNKIVPCISGSGSAMTTLRPDQVKTSALPSLDDPQAKTTFTLPAPVHLMPGQEYAVVVRSDSDAYRVYIATLGASIIGSDAKVGKQPYAGSFFKSQNASTWTESPFEDLMFRLNRATWNASAATPVTGLLVARAVAPVANTTFDSFEFYPHEVQFSELTSTDYTLDIKPWNPATDDLTGSIAVRYDVLPNQWSLLAARSMLQGYGGSDAANSISLRTSPFTGATIPAANTVDAIVSLTTMSPDVAPVVDLKKMNLLGVRHLINDLPILNSDIVFINPGAGYLANLQTGLVNTTSGSATVTGDGSTNFVTSLLVGDTVAIGGNVEVVVQSITNTTQFIATSTLSVTRIANTFWTYGAPLGNNTTTLTITDGNGTGATGYLQVGRDGKVSNIVMTAFGSGYSGKPIFTAGTPAVVAGYNVTQSTALIGYNSELGTFGGNGLTRYMTRPVTLAPGFDARDIRVTFDAYRPVGSHFYVYYKVLAGDADTVRFEDQPWRLMTQETSDGVFSTGYFQFKEFNFTTPHEQALNLSTDTTDKFKVFAVKIVMASTDTVDVPRIANFRAIALDQ
jgi:hypothetical protein